MLRRVLACGGFSTKVTSVCQWLERPSSLSTGSTFRAPATAGDGRVRRGQLAEVAGEALLALVIDADATE